MENKDRLAHGCLGRVGLKKFDADELNTVFNFFY